MTKSAAPTEKLSATNRLPWWIAGGALLFYGLTLNHWISLNSLGTVARLAEWSWRPEIGRPLTWVVFAPFRLLPEAWLPLGLNLFTAVCAALVLGQLARSVAILRYDVAPADPMRKTKSAPPLLTGAGAWLPPLFAVLVCGLQLGFWEHATAASGEMLSLWCFAYALRCLLEFRFDPQHKWLSRCVFVFAAGLTDNWLMAGYLPMIMAGIIWVKGYSPCLNWRFLGQLMLGALLGLSLYLLIPIWLRVTAPDQYEFWPTLKSYLSGQKQNLQALRLPAFRLIALTALLPFILLAVRWRSHTVELADDTHQGVFVTKASGHIIHGLFFITALWLALNPLFTPRQLELNSPLLVYYYPWAMVAGYGIGYLLLFGRPRGTRRGAKWPAFATLSLLLLLPAILLAKNFADIRLTNGPALREFARQLSDDLPAGHVAVLSDEPRPLLLLRAQLVALGREKNFLLIDTRSLPWPEYHRQMAQTFPSRWPDVLPTNRVTTLSAGRLLLLVRQLAAQESVVYLQPSSGFFLEEFSTNPHGWVQRLERRADESPAPRNIWASTDNNSLWQTRWEKNWAARAAQFQASRDRTAWWSHPSRKRFKLASRPNETASMLASAYAKMLNHWGVQAQRQSMPTSAPAEATLWFQRALAFDPDNLAAQINLEFAQRRHQGETNRLLMAWVRENFPHLLNKYNTWADVISRNGPVDEPTFLLHTGRMYLAANLPQQSLAAFRRSAELAPDWIAPKMWQAQNQNLLGNFAAALVTTEELTPLTPRLTGAGLAQLLQIRTMALHQSGQTNEARAFLEQFTTTHQAATAVLATAADLCAATGTFESELKWRAQLGQRDPKNIEWLVKHGHAELRTKDYAAALKTLTTALGLQPNHSQARLFRAVAALRAGQLEGARADFRELSKAPEHAASAWFGLGSVAWRQQDTNAMIHYYQTFLSNSAAATPQAVMANQRLKEWQDE